MKILIVDNNTKHIEELKKLCSSFTTDIFVIKWGEVDPQIKGFDLIILSGGKGLAIDQHEEELAKEIELIKNSATPIIGVCLGFELIAHTFGCKMIREDEIQKGLFEINVIQGNPIFEGRHKFTVYMAHKWHVKEVDPVLIALAGSKKGIEIVKHGVRPIYGFQFHPEVIMDGNTGTQLVKNCINLLTGSTV